MGSRQSLVNMKTFSLALAQCHPSCEGAVEDNVALMDSCLEKACTKGADLVVFPEATISGYILDINEIRARALAIDSTPIGDAIELSQKHSVHCGFGFYERSGDRIYNSYALAGQGSLIGIQRKVHTPPRERALFTPGSGFKVFDLPFAKVGLSICYDNEFPESHTALALMGAEVIIMPAGWAEHWEREDYIEECVSDDEVVAERCRWMHMMFGARCRDTGTYSALVNHSGIEVHGPSRFVGKSMVFAPTGKAIAEACAWDEELLCTELNAQQLQDYRSMDAYILKARRPEAYGPLVADTRGGDNGEQ